MNSIEEEKARLRKTMAELKKAISIENRLIKSHRIFAAIEKKTWFHKSGIILTYWAMPDEVQTRDFILKWYGVKQFLLPVVRGNVLELRIFRGEENLIKGTAFNISEPDGQEFAEFESIDAVVVPGVSFDKNLNRLGRGKAYYDNLLSKLPNAFRAGVCFDFQYMQAIPSEEHDVKMHEVIFA